MLQQLLLPPRCGVEWLESGMEHDAGAEVELGRAEGGSSRSKKKKKQATAPTTKTLLMLMPSSTGPAPSLHPSVARPAPVSGSGRRAHRAGGGAAVW